MVDSSATGVVRGDRFRDSRMRSWVVGAAACAASCLVSATAVWSQESGGGAAPPPTPPFRATRSFRSAVMPLRYSSPAVLENSLKQLGGGAITVVPQASGERAVVQLHEEGSTRPLLEVDRRNRRVYLLAPPSERAAWRRVVGAIDQAPHPNRTTTLVPLGYADPDQVRQAMQMIRTTRPTAPAPQPLPPADRAGADHDARLNQGPPLLARLFQQPPTTGQPAGGAGGAGQAGNAGQAGAGNQGAPQGTATTLGDVQIEFIPELGVIIVRGKEADVKRVRQIIEQIETMSRVTKPEIRLFPLQHANSQAIAELITTVHEKIFQPRLGEVSVTGLGRPNAVLAVGSAENLKTIAELIEKLDQPAPPQAQVRIFSLEHLSASDAETYLQTFFGGGQGQTQQGGQATQPTGLSPRVTAIADPRSNALIVQASPRDMLEVESILKKLDVDQTAGMLKLKVIPLKNAMASELASVLQYALGVQAPNARAAQGQGQQAPQNTQQQNLSPAAKTLQMVGIDRKTRQLVASGILSDVTITADTNTNSLIVRASSKSLPLIEQLIEQLDALPAAEAQIKVFQITNGDATNLTVMLQQLFGLPVTAGQIGAFSQTFGSTFGAAQLNQQTAGETSLIPLRFAVDARTNSIVATGSAGDLAVVEAILLRLDEGNIRQRKNQVYRLNNAPAQFVADALQQILQQNTQLLLQQQNQQFSLISQFELIDAQVFVVPEPISNSLIVSATPKYFDQIAEVIADLDRRPPMVMVQVLMARVQLDQAHELGAELGIQDSLLFDRSSVVDGLLSPGFAFLGAPLGNADTTASRATRNQLAGQAVSSFNVGRTSAGSGFGGLVLSASNESINILLRALEADSKLQVLSRPQIMTLNNVPASILVGQRVPRVSNFQNTNNGTVNSVELDEVGLSLGVIPRVSPDGLITMDIEIRDSNVGPVEDGIPIGVQDGVAINSPIFNDITAITTVTARSGQTIVFSGLISKERSNSFRGVPVLSHVPVVGRLFRFDANTEKRNELLIFLTPHIVASGEYEDAARINQLEAQRMSWCMADVVELHGDPGFGVGDKGVFGPGPAHEIVPDGYLQAVPPAGPDQRPAVVPDHPRQSPLPFLVPPEQQRQQKPFLEPQRVPLPMSGSAAPAGPPPAVEPVPARPIQAVPRPTAPPGIQPAQYQYPAPYPAGPQ